MTGPIAYLGPQGTFSEVAARQVADGDDLLACAGVTDVLAAVESGRAERGVVPIENTLEGAVTATLDALAFDSDLLIEAELELPIELVLAAAPGTELSDVRAVLTHPIPLAGCGRWLSRALPDAERRPVASTARAAAEVADAGPGSGAAAIVNVLAAERYDLEVVATDIADVPGNATRFVVVGRTLAPPTGWDKTSLVVYIHRSRPGALLALLEIFAERGLDLTKIESRPTKHELGDYCFFLDVEGHLAEERVGDALAAVKRTQRDVKVLGSYPRLGAAPPGPADPGSTDAAYRDAATWLASWRTRIGR